MSWSQDFTELARKMDSLSEHFSERATGRYSGSGRANNKFISPKGMRAKQSIGDGIEDAMTDDENGIVSQAKKRASSHVTREAVESIQYERGSWNAHRFGATHELIKYHEYGTGTKADDSSKATINAPDGTGYVIPLDGYDSLPFGPDAVGQMQELDFQFVVHPGVRGKHFMQKALEGRTWLIEKKVAERLDDIQIDV